MPQNPYDSASYISKLTFSWAGELLKFGATHELVVEHVPDISEQDSSKVIVERLLFNWHMVKHGNRPLFRAMLMTYWKEYWWIGILLLVTIPLKVFIANLVGYLIQYFFDNGIQSNYGYYNNGYIISLLILCSSLILVLLQHQFSFLSYRFGMQLRIGLNGMIYNKAVRLQLKALSKTAAGRVVSLAAQDIEILQSAGIFYVYIYQPIIEAIVICYFAVQEIGLSFLVGFIAIILLLPLQTIFSRIIGNNRKLTAFYTDERIKRVNQSLVGVRIMKINGWEWAFRDLIQLVREKEVASLMNTNYLKAINEVLMIYICSLELLICSYYIIGNIL